MLGKPDQRDHVAHLGRDLVDRPPPGGEEVGLEQEILGRVAVHGELGEDRDLGAGRARAVQRVDDRGLVAIDVADGRVDLGERDPQRLSDCHRGDSRHRQV